MKVTIIPIYSLTSGYEDEVMKEGYEEIGITIENS